MAAKGKKKALCVEINLLPAENRQTKLDLSWIVDRRIVWPTIALIVALFAVFMVQSYISETTQDLQGSMMLVAIQTICMPERVDSEKISVSPYE